MARAPRAAPAANTPRLVRAHRAPRARRRAQPWTPPRAPDAHVRGRGTLLTPPNRGGGAACAGARRHWESLGAARQDGRGQQARGHPPPHAAHARAHHGQRAARAGSYRVRPELPPSHRVPRHMGAGSRTRYERRRAAARRRAGPPRPRAPWGRPQLGPGHTRLASPVDGPCTPAGGGLTAPGRGSRRLRGSRASACNSEGIFICVRSQNRALGRGSAPHLSAGPPSRRASRRPPASPGAAPPPAAAANWRTGRGHSTPPTDPSKSARVLTVLASQAGARLGPPSP